MTFRAIARRQGIYDSVTAETVNFNEDLVKSIMKDIQVRWQHAFETQFEQVAADFQKTATENLDTFHDYIVTNVELSKLSSALLNDQIRAQKRKVMKIERDINSQITSFRREAPRAMAPAVRSAMSQAYDTCAAQSGPGMFQRMKDAMSTGVETAKQTMFGNAFQKVRKVLEEGLRDTTLPYLRKEMNEVFNTIDRDTRRMLPRVQKQIPTDANEEGQLKLELLKTLVKNDQVFKEILDECEGDGNAIAVQNIKIEGH
jgi:hypothetical protein